MGELRAEEGRRQPVDQAGGPPGQASLDKAHVTAMRLHGQAHARADLVRALTVTEDEVSLKVIGRSTGAAISLTVAMPYSG